jgi:hypothetical protein
VLVRRQDHRDAARDRHAQVCHSQLLAARWPSMQPRSRDRSVRALARG